MDDLGQLIIFFMCAAIFGMGVSSLLVLITAASGDYILAAVFGALFVCCGVKYIT